MPKTTKTEKKLSAKKNVEPIAKQPSYYQAIGRRKEASCRIRLFVSADSGVTVKGTVIKKGDIVVNNRPIDKYFPGEIYKKLYLEPFRTTNTLGRFTTSAIISGGGLKGQLGAFIHAVSRALQVVDREKYRSILKSKLFLKRDARVKERRKAGFAQKARAKKQSPKR